MVILFDATKTRKIARSFAAGLLAFVPMTTISHTATDEALYAAEQADREQAARDFDQHLGSHNHRNRNVR
jgi:rhamnose utilization protein RhaD (predicted bifunctional aldolase and dehydrogenase)